MVYWIGARENIVCLLAACCLIHHRTHFRILPVVRRSLGSGCIYMIHTCACFIASLVCKYDVDPRSCRCENANMQIQLASIAWCVRSHTDEGNTNQMRHVNNRQTDDSRAIFTTRSARAKLTAANYLPTSLGESCSEHRHARFPPICVLYCTLHCGTRRAVGANICDEYVRECVRNIT